MVYNYAAVPEYFQIDYRTQGSMSIFKMTVARGGLRGLSGMRAMGAILTGVEKYCTKWALVALCCNLVGWDGWMDGSYPIDSYDYLSTCSEKNISTEISDRYKI